MRVQRMGIGGARVSALACVYLARGDEVSGCDVQESETTAELEDAGVAIEVGHDPEHVLGKDLLVYSGAVREDAPELVAARSMGVEIHSRAQALAGFIAESDSIAVAGSHGKTTVTHMTGHILTDAGFDPTVLVGDGSHSRAGRSRWLLAEVDESDGSLVMHHPKRASEVVLSVVDVASALERFPGAHRRLEFLGVFQGATVYDDYGHHPTEVRATIQGARELRHRRVIVVFQPHRYSRLAAFLQPFSRSFEGADRVVLLDVYSAGEDNPTGVTARDLASQIPGAIYAGSFERVREVLEGLVGPDD